LTMIVLIQAFLDKPSNNLKQTKLIKINQDQLVDKYNSML